MIQSLPVRNAPRSLMAYWTMVSRATATATACHVTKRQKSIVDEAVNFSLVSDAQLGTRQCLDEVTVVAIGASVTRSYVVRGWSRSYMKSGSCVKAT